MFNRKVLKRILTTEEGPHRVMLFQEFVEKAGGEDALVDEIIEMLDQQGVVIEDITDSPFGEEVWCRFDGRLYALLPDPEK